MDDRAPLPHRKLMRRWEGERDVRFLTFSCYSRLPLLTNDRIKQLFVERVGLLRQQGAFALLAWVIMPEHVHALLLPTRPVAEIARELKRPVAEAVLRRWRALDAPILKRVMDKNGVAHFWLAGGGYDRNVRTDAELERDVDYIHANPCRRGLADEQTDYPWSSARWYAGLPSLLPCDRIGA